MKNLLLILLVFVLSSGCRTTKKTVSNETKATRTADLRETHSSQSVVTIDTTKSVDQEITYSKIEYYKPPSTASRSGGAPLPERSAERSRRSLVEGQAIKSVETITVRKKTEAKGKIEAVSTEKTETNAQTIESIDTEIKQTEKPAPDPRRWMWIFGIMALGTGIVMYLKRSGIFSWIKSVLSGIGKLLKI